MFWFLQSQAAVGALLALSIALAAHNANPVVRMQDLVGFALLVVAVVGEAIADRQLRLFTSNPSNRAAVCDVGLWSWSRHPNYFFEWLSWLAYPIVAIDLAGHNPYGWLALAAPVSMYWVLVHVSGIPPLEKHMLQISRRCVPGISNTDPCLFPISHDALTCFGSVRSAAGCRQFANRQEANDRCERGKNGSPCNINKSERKCPVS